MAGYRRAAEVSALCDFLRPQAHLVGLQESQKHPLAVFISKGHKQRPQAAEFLRQSRPRLHTLPAGIHPQFSPFPLNDLIIARFIPDGAFGTKNERVGFSTFFAYFLPSLFDFFGILEFVHKLLTAISIYLLKLAVYNGRIP